MDKPVRKQKPKKVKCVVKRPFRYSDNTPTRRKGEVSLSQEEYQWAYSIGCIEEGGE